MRGLLAVFALVGCGEVKFTPDARVADAAVDAEVDAPDAPPDAFVNPASCKDYKARIPEAGNGVYAIDPDGPAGPIMPFLVYCDMTNDGGGWTLAMSLAVDPTGLTWNGLVPSYSQPTSPTQSTAAVLHYEAVTAMNISQMMLMGGDRIIKFMYPRTGVSFVNNYRDITERQAFRTENVPADAPHTGTDREMFPTCGHISDACATTDFAIFKAADPSCPRDATNSHTVTGCTNNCGSWGNCPGNGFTPPSPTPNCWFYGGANAVTLPTISNCPVTSQAPWGNYTTGTITGFYTLWVR